MAYSRHWLYVWASSWLQKIHISFHLRNNVTKHTAILLSVSSYMEKNMCIAFYFSIFGTKYLYWSVLSTSTPQTHGEVSKGWCGVDNCSCWPHLGRVHPQGWVKTKIEYAMMLMWLWAIGLRCNCLDKFIVNVACTRVVGNCHVGLPFAHMPLPPIIAYNRADTPITDYLRLFVPYLKYKVVQFFPL
jgi:hypothetical protein